jgi:ABC-type transport system involved in cytochrome c biogenesis permease subunit
VKNSKLAIVSLVLGIFSFIHLLGIEKAVLSVVFGVLALKEIGQTQKYKKIAYVGISLGIIYLLIVTVILTFYSPQLLNILRIK